MDGKKAAMALYVKGLKNTNKKQYAKCYAEYLLGTRRDAPLHGTFSLTVMGAQAVRLALTEILNAR